MKKNVYINIVVCSVLVVVYISQYSFFLLSTLWSMQIDHRFVMVGHLKRFKSSRTVSAQFFNHFMVSLAPWESGK